MVDEFGRLLEQDDAFIINTDKSDGAGIHWITMYPKDNTLYIIDSLGKNNERPYDKIMFKIIKQHGLKPVFYHDNFQYADNSHCGWYAIYVAKLINKNKDADIFEMLDDVFGANGADDNDIKVLEEAFGKDGSDKLDKTFGLGTRKYDLDVEINGEGIMDWIKNFGKKVVSKVQDVKYALTSNRMNFKPSMREMLKIEGDIPIIKMKVGRSPLNSKINLLLDLVNKVSGYKAPPHDTLFHLYIIFYLQNDKVVLLEKNQDINMEYYRNKSVEDIVDVTTPSGLTINNMLNDTINKVGKDRVFSYDAYSNNCQQFVYDVLQSNGINISPSLKSFILQPVENLTNSFGKRITKFFTDVANRAGIAISGKGLKDIQFRKSQIPSKKYDAILKDGTVVSFGSATHEQYRDNVLGLYSNLDHNDEKRRELFRKRFNRAYEKTDKFSPLWFSYNLLW